MPETRARSDVLSPAPPTAVEDAWVETLLGYLRTELAEAGGGQCLRLSGLPRALLERATAALAREIVAPAEVYLVDQVSGPEIWRVGVHKVVERRNAEAPVVLAVIPPDVHLAAQDSVDVSTFRELPLGGVSDAVTASLLESLPPSVRAFTELVLADLHRRGWPITATSCHWFLAHIAHQQSQDLWPVGASLFAIGLVPDFTLGDVPDHLPHRIGQLNIPSVYCLSERARTAVERVLRLPIDRGADGATDFARRLSELFTHFDSSEPQAWGRAVATDPEWRALSLDQWPFGSQPPPPGHVRIDVLPLRLPRREDGLLIADAEGGLVVGWESTPKAIDVPGLATFRIELVTSDDVVAWESALVKAGKTKSQRRTVKKLHIEPGVYRARVTALTGAGDTLPQQEVNGADERASNESEDFLLVGEIDETDVVAATTAATARSYADAEIMARWSALKSGISRSRSTPTIEWTTGLEAPGETANASIRFDLQRQYTLRLSQTLSRIEAAIHASPDVLRWRVDLDARAGEAVPVITGLPESFRSARARVLDAISGTPIGNGPGVVALVDLRRIATDLDAYARAYLDWLRSGDADALLLDTVLAHFSGATPVLLVAPTHPLRLLWSAQEHQLGTTWADEAEARGASDTGPLRSWQDLLALQDVPLLEIVDAEHGYVDAGPLPGGWGLYLPSGERDSRSLAARVRRRLASGTGHDNEADVGPARVAGIIGAFLRQHPYITTLVLNVVNPGDAALVVDALKLVERDLGHTAPRYEIRLFTFEAPGPAVGRSLTDLLDPDTRLSEEAARLAGPGLSFLFPKLTWSRLNVRELVDRPESYPAHVALVLDAFPISLRVVERRTDRRSSHVHGLVQDALREPTGGGEAYSWSRIPAPAACTELPGSPGRSALIADLLAATSIGQAAQLAPMAGAGDGYATTALDLSISGQSLLYAAHLSSAWVLTLDAHLGLDYFDSGIGSDRPAYLLDFTPEFVASGGRRLLLTTRELDEVSRLMQPALQGLNLTQGDPMSAQALIEALRSLSGRLALRLQSSPAQVQGVLGIALSRLVLEAYGLLEDALVIPLDAHPDLADDREDPLAPRLRSDLLIVRADPESRVVDFLVVETKCTNADHLNADLRQRIHEQVSASEESLRRLFEPHDDNDRIDRVVMSWRLSQLLDFYLGRASRYGLVSATAETTLRGFYSSLESGYRLETRRTGLVFALGARSTSLDTADPDLPIWVVGRDAIDVCAKDARERLALALGQSASTPDAVRATTTEALEADRETWERVRATLGPTTSKGLHPPTRATRLAPKASAGSGSDGAISVESAARQIEGGPGDVRAASGHAEPTSNREPNWTLKPGQQIKRAELHDRFGGNRQRGISPCRETPNVLLFSDPASGVQHGYVDRFVDADLFEYTGEGQRGDQEMTLGNLAISGHKKDGRQLRLFAGAGGNVTYIGEFEVDAPNPHFMRSAPSTAGGASRKVIVFRLRPVGEVAPWPFAGERSGSPVSGSQDVSDGQPTQAPALPPEVAAVPEDLTPAIVGADGQDDDGQGQDQSPPALDVLLGDTKLTPQYGLLGSVSNDPRRSVGIDLNGCNTVSIFGVQGGGKSYTVGSIIEMAVKALPRLNLLPSPLAAVVFHYHQTQDYPPEFVSMNEPNREADEIAALAELGGRPAGIDDVLVLTTADTLEQRRLEFPSAAVEAISFASSELTVADWRFLMGATSNDALYLRLVDEVIRTARANLSIDAIEAGVEQAPMSDSQRQLAMTRLAFARRFIDDEHQLRPTLKPGRLVIVDLRDEFVERDQALGLFVTMLNVFSGAGLRDQPFNKLIVFDEAHKYMGGTLIGHVVDVIRQMRHKGVSVVIASQDPVNVPPSVIELSSVVVLHRFNSPNWLKHIQKALAALIDLTPQMLASLAPGEGYVWANRSTDPVFTRRAVKVRMRPRASRHGGSTRTAVE